MLAHAKPSRSGNTSQRHPHGLQWGQQSRQSGLRRGFPGFVDGYSFIAVKTPFVAVTFSPLLKCQLEKKNSGKVTYQKDWNNSSPLDKHV